MLSADIVGRQFYILYAEIDIIGKGVDNAWDEETGNTIKHCTSRHMTN